ncbi:hypothetical protein PFISCL1PPCAC_9112, partial [Pristionchus fissidentatus]
KCEYRNDTHVWVMGEKVINRNSNVECRETKSCDLYLHILYAQCEKAPDDSRCIVAADNLPHCSNNKLHVDGRLSNISCNINDGKYRVNGSILLSSEAKLD